MTAEDLLIQWRRFERLLKQGMEPGAAWYIVYSMREI